MYNYEVLKETMMGMTYVELEDAIKNDAIVLLPVGVVEAHGPHMPLGTDIFISLNQSIGVKKCIEKAGRACVIAPPFYFGGTKAMTRQFVGTFTSPIENIMASVEDIFASLERFGFLTVVIQNAHGDELHKQAIIGAITESNKKRKMKVYWPEYREDLAWTGFCGDEDYLILIDSREDDSAFKIDKMPRDEFDVHAGAYETAVMADICPDMVYAERTDHLKPTMLKDAERLRWNEGNKEDIVLTPNAYVGDPAYYRYIHAHMGMIYEEYAKSLVQKLDEICYNKTDTQSSVDKVSTSITEKIEVFGE